MPAEHASTAAQGAARSMHCTAAPQITTGPDGLQRSHAIWRDGHHGAPWAQLGTLAHRHSQARPAWQRDVTLGNPGLLEAKPGLCRLLPSAMDAVHPTVVSQDIRVQARRACRATIAPSIALQAAAAAVVQPPRAPLWCTPERAGRSAFLAWQSGGRGQPTGRPGRHQPRTRRLQELSWLLPALQHSQGR